MALDYTHAGRAASDHDAPGAGNRTRRGAPRPPCTAAGACGGNTGWVSGVVCARALAVVGAGMTRGDKARALFEVRSRAEDS